MINKTLAVVLLIAGAILFLVGLFNNWPRHMLLGALGINGGAVMLWLTKEEK